MYTNTTMDPSDARDRCEELLLEAGAGITGFTPDVDRFLQNKRIPFGDAFNEQRRALNQESFFAARVLTQLVATAGQHVTVLNLSGKDTSAGTFNLHHGHLPQETAARISLVRLPVTDSETLDHALRFGEPGSTVVAYGQPYDFDLLACQRLREIGFSTGRQIVVASHAGGALQDASRVWKFTDTGEAFNAELYKVRHANETVARVQLPLTRNAHGRTVLM